MMPGLTEAPTDVAAGFENQVKGGTPLDESGNDPAVR